MYLLALLHAKRLYSKHFYYRYFYWSNSLTHQKNSVCPPTHSTSCSNIFKISGGITLKNSTLTTHCCYSTLDIEWATFHLYVHQDPIVLPKCRYVYGVQPNLLTDFDAPGPYQILFMASYLDLCTPIPPAFVHEAIPCRTENTKLWTTYFNYY